MEEDKSKEEDAVKLFLEIFEPANASLPSRKDIKSFQDLITFSDKYDATKQQTDTESIWQTNQNFYVTTVLGLRIEKRTLGWKALIAILNYLNNSINLRAEFFNKCQAILDYLQSNGEKVSDRDYNVTLFCLNILEHYRKAATDQRPSFSKSKALVEFVKNVLKICHRLAFTQSSATLTSFKCLTTIIEVSRKTIDAKDEFFDVCCRNEQLDIIMSNWENPNPAVRKLVKELFAGWLTVEDKCYHKKAVECDCSINALRMDLMEHIMKSITWKHSFEFRILVAMFDSISFNETRSLAGTREEYFIKIKDGLLLSLKSHELASSGAELFDKLFTCIEWIKWFHDPIKDYLCSDNRVFITNIIKYWMPVILKKFRTYTLLDYLLTRDSVVENRTSLWYLSAIKMLRIKRKRGNFYHLGEFGQIFLQRCLTCSDEDVRCDAFAALCETSTGLEPWEYQLVKQFLVENVNYDRANLRQNMVNCCVSFFLRVRGSKIAKRNKYSTKSLPSKQIQEHDKEVALNFVEDLHQFLIENLQTHCNYQRKMTSLMLYNAVLIYFGVGGGREKDQRKSNTKDKSGVIEEQATKAGKWNFRSKNDRKLLFACIDDISDSVRITASDLLMNHFKWDKEDQEEINNFYKLGKEMCSSRLFYKIESGALLIKTVTIIAFKSDYSLIVNMLKNSNPIVFNETIIPNVTNDLILLAKRQLSVVSKDIFMASVQGHPLHGVLKALLLLLTDKTQFNYKESLRNVQVKDILNESNGTFANFSNKLTNYYNESKPESCDQLEEILNILEKTVKTMIALLSFNQYDPPEDVAFSPSFAEMGKSLEEIVKQSEISNNHDDEVLMLSVPHQLVLNCIWFNLKICCQFASGLITSGMVANSKAGSCARCFAIIETVLNKCRHKGAIDVAGSSMFSAANAVMEEPDKFSAEERNLPTKILDDFLKNMRSNSGCSLSRRSAGRSFLVHSIVASDPQPNSPLLSKTLSRLIEIIYEDQTQTELSLVDSPQVNALHILSTLLQDTRLNVLPYAKEIFCVCFEKLSSPIYTVKNAALQLFKSWLMRLMRRMKGESVMNETDNHQTTPLEELYRHMPQLFSFIEKKLDSLSSETDINSHAKLVPILVFLSNISITFFKEYNESYKKFSENVRDYVGRLLSSRVLFVRKLSARINSNMLLIHELSTEINSTAIRIEHAFLDNFLDQNLLHGLVMNLKYLSARLISYQREINPSNPNLEIEREAENVARQCLITLIKSRQTCYFVKSLALDVINLWTPTFTVRTNSSDSLTTIKSSIVHYKPQLGSSLWLEKVVRNICIKDTSPDLKRFCLLGNTVSDVALACLRSCDLKPEEDSELVLEVFKSRRHPEVIHPLLKKIQGEFVFNDLKLLNFIYDVIVKKSKDEEFQCIDKGLGMLLICKILSSLSSDEFFSSDLSLGVLNCLCVWSSSSQMNENWRSVASECVICFRGCFLKKMFTKILIEEEVFDQKSDKLGSLLWKTLFNLLQDENLEIRLKACEFFPGFYLTSNVEVPNPFVALRKLVEIQFMLQIMNLKTAIDQLWTVLSSGSVIESIEMTSPYDHGIDNFYKDETWLRKVIHSELKSVCDKSIFCRDYLKERYKYTISS